MTITISNSVLSAVINSKGAELQSLQDMRTGKEYIWSGNPDFWGKHSPILFPIVGTLKSNSFRFNGNDYTLLRHGFARDFNFKLKNQETDKVVFSLQSTDTTKQNFPFDFELLLTYSLIETTLTVSYTVLNSGTVTMPFSIGGHPAFVLPKPFSEYSLLFEINENLISYTLENDLISDMTKELSLENKILPLSYSLFANDALIFKSMQSKEIQILDNGIPFLNFCYADFPHFGIWTKVGAPFICLEPWAGYSDTVHTSGNIMEKEAIQLLESNCSRDFSFSIEIV